MFGSAISFSLILGLLILVGTGCATNRGILTINERESQLNRTGVAVKINKIVDMRHFEPEPSDPSTPSLKRWDEINDKKITERAVARKRNSYGKAMGDILLPEGKTVGGLVESAVIKALRRLSLSGAKGKSTHGIVFHA